MSARLSSLQSQFNEARASIEATEAHAVEQGRDLTDQEVADTDVLYARCEALKAEIEPLADRDRSLAATAEVLSRISPTRPIPTATRKVEVETKLPSAAEYISGYVRSFRSHEDAEEFEHMRTVAQVKLADTPGLVPTPIVGGLVDLIGDDQRPVFNSFSHPQMPDAGKSFLRPRLQQRTLVGRQVHEFDELASRTFKVTSDEVSKQTWGGVVEISQQDIDWSTPGVLGLIINDLIGEMASVTEQAACNAFIDALTVDSPFVSTTTGAVLESLTDAAIAVYGGSKRLPTHLWLSLDQWGVLASLVDGQDRPLFPNLGAGAIDLSAGTFSGSPLGLKVTVAPGLEAGTIIMGNAALAEAYEKRNGLLSVTQPSVLGYQVAVSSYVAFNFYPGGFVYLGSLS